MINPDEILRNRLGPPPIEVLEKLIKEYPDMLACTVVIQRSDETLILASGGCTILETVGMSQFGAHLAARSLEGGEEEPDTA